MVITKSSFRYDTKTGRYISGSQGGGYIKYDPSSQKYVRYGSNRPASYTQDQFESMLSTGQRAELQANVRRLRESREKRPGTREFQKVQDQQQGVLRTRQEIDAAKRGAEMQSRAEFITKRQFETQRAEQISKQQRDFMVRQREQQLVTSPQAQDIFRRQEETKTVGGIIRRRVPTSVVGAGKLVGQVVAEPVKFGARVGRDVYQRVPESVKAQVAPLKQTFIDLPGGAVRGLYKDTLSKPIQRRLETLEQRDPLKTSFIKLTGTKLQQSVLKGAEFTFTKPVETAVGVTALGGLSSAGRTALIGTSVGKVALSQRPKEAASTVVSAGVILGAAKAVRTITTPRKTLIETKFKELTPKQVSRAVSKSTRRLETSRLTPGVVESKTKRFLFSKEVGGFPQSKVTVETIKSGQIKGVGKIDKGLFVSTDGTTRGFVDLPKQKVRALITQTPKTTQVKYVDMVTGKVKTSPSSLTLERTFKTRDPQFFKIRKDIVDAPGERMTERTFGRTKTLVETKVRGGELQKDVVNVLRGSRQIQKVTVEPGRYTAKIGQLEFTDTGGKFVGETLKKSTVPPPKIKFGSEVLPSISKRVTQVDNKLLYQSFQPGSLVQKVTTKTVGAGTRTITSESLLGLKARRVASFAIKAPAYAMGGAIPVSVSPLSVQQYTQVSAPVSPTAFLRARPDIISPEAITTLAPPSKVLAAETLALGTISSRADASRRLNLPKLTTDRIVRTRARVSVLPRTDVRPASKVKVDLRLEPTTQQVTRTVTDTTPTPTPSKTLIAVTPTLPRVPTTPPPSTPILDLDLPKVPKRKRRTVKFTPRKATPKYSYSLWRPPAVEVSEKQFASTIQALGATPQGLSPKIEVRKKRKKKFETYQIL